MDGFAAQAIRDAEASLARQQTATAQIDLQVVSAVLNAHTDRDRGSETLERLQQDVETAVAACPDLDTPAGARSFQRYLIGRLRDIRTVVDDADLDATSKAALAAALSSLYASSEEPPGAEESARPDAATSDPGVVGPKPAPPEGIPAEAAAPPPVPQAAAMPAWGSPAPASGGFPAMSTPSVPEPSSNTDPAPVVDHPGHHAALDPQAEPAGDVALAAGESATVPRPELADVITAAVAGTPIPEAFARQGITVPAVGSPVADPVDPDQLTAGDIGVFADRHALALGNGKALLDNQIQPVTAIGGPGFIGWQHPPAPATGQPTTERSQA